MPTAMAENTTNSQRQVNHGAPIARITRIEVPSEEHEEMNKMAHGVSEALRYTQNRKTSKNLHCINVAFNVFSRQILNLLFTLHAHFSLCVTSH